MVTKKPILFSSAMVRAILAGQKTQTRRVISGDNRGAYWDHRGYRPIYEGRGLISFHPNHGDAGASMPFRRPCPYDADRLWVRETWRPVMERFRSYVEYSADGGAKDAPPGLAMDFAKMALRFPGARKDRHSETWHPSIHMPRWACRLVLAVESIRVERLNDISEEDARAEGALVAAMETGLEIGQMWTGNAREAFANLWQSINGKRPGCSWDANPWVWRVEFSRVAP